MLRFVIAGMAFVSILGASLSPKIGQAVEKFPKSFLWGAATAAHQIEGNNTLSDWWDWEEQCHLENCEKSGLGGDGYNRYPEDLAIAQKMGLGAYRMSIEWARIEPAPGVFSVEEFKHYRDVLIAVRARGMKVVLTLQHFTLPSWVARRAPLGHNSWLDPEVPVLFGRYADRVATELGDLVDYWLTVNEPTVSMLTGYIVGLSPPGLKDFKKGPEVLANFVKAHAQAYHAIHRHFPKAQVSFAHHARVFDPYHFWSPLDVMIARALSDFWNHQFIQSIVDGKIRFHIPFVVDLEQDAPEIRGTLDFLGLNYYTRDLIQFKASAPEKFVIQPNKRAPKNDEAWEIYPEGMYRVLKDFARYRLPIMITENGTADAGDLHRGKYICDHLREVRHAMDDGVNVTGYLHWALIDNFEWSRGYGPRFGLVAVDYENGQTRTPRASAALYERIVRERGLGACSP